MENRGDFHEQLKNLMDTFVHRVYDCTQQFPREELFGTTSQLRRAALSVILNYIEGYARNRSVAVHRNFLDISYGSLRESRYLVEFSHKRAYLSTKDYQELTALNDRIGAMLWGILSRMRDTNR